MSFSNLKDESVEEEPEQREEDGEEGDGEEIGGRRVGFGVPIDRRRTLEKKKFHLGEVFEFLFGREKKRNRELCVGF